MMAAITTLTKTCRGRLVHSRDIPLAFGGTHSRSARVTRVFTPGYGVVLAAAAASSSSSSSSDMSSEKPEKSYERRMKVDNVSWGTNALQHCSSALSAVNENGPFNLALYAVDARPTKLEVRLDNLDDPRGSPSLVHVESFSRELLRRLEASWEDDGSFPLEQVDVEVSTAGANRAVHVPDELERFKGQPLDVVWTNEGGKRRAETLMYSPDDAPTDGVQLAFRYAQVKANRGEKGRPMSRKKREEVLLMDAHAVASAHIHVDL